MFKRISAVILALALFLGLAGITLATSPHSEAERGGAASTDPSAAPLQGTGIVSTSAPEPEAAFEPEASAEPAEAASRPEPEDCSFWLNGQPVYDMDLQVIDGVLYCPIRTFFEHALDEADVAWVDDRAQVTGTTAGGETLTLTARPGDCWLTANDRCLYVEHGIKLEDDVTMAPLGILAWVFPGTTWGYDPQADRTIVTLGQALLPSGADFYNAEDLDLIARVIYQEARYEPMVGKIALGNVITNRVAQSNFPNNVHDVLYARNQFTVVNGSRFWKQTPNDACVTAAKLALEGVSILPTAVYYNVKGMNSWAARNRPYVGTIGNHSFYSG